MVKMIAIASRYYIINYLVRKFYLDGMGNGGGDDSGGKGKEDA